MMCEERDPENIQCECQGAIRRRAHRDVLRQMQCVGVSAQRSTGLPWQQAQNDSPENGRDEGNITLRGTGVCLSNSSASVYETACVNEVQVAVGGLSVL